MKTYFFIINPISGNGQKQKTIDLIDKVLSDRNIKYEIKLTEYAGHASEIAKNICNTPNCVIVAVGGDGSLNEVAQSLLGSESSLGIIPQGSGNGLARHLKIPMDTEAALLELLNGESVKMDAGTLNGKHFFVTCGIGFDAEVSYSFSKGNLRGLAGYVKESMILYPMYKSKKYRITNKGKTIEHEAFSISVANASQYGNDAVIAKDASISDSLLDLCVLKKFPKLLGFHLGISMFMQNIQQSSYFIGEQIEEIEIEHLGKGGVCNAQIDGESIEAHFPVKIKVIPNSINIIVPKN